MCMHIKGSNHRERMFLLLRENAETLHEVKRLDTIVVLNFILMQT